MGSRLMDALRSALGMTQSTPPQEHDAVVRRLEQQAAKLRAIDEKVAVDFPKGPYAHPMRRSTDRQ